MQSQDSRIAIRHKIAKAFDSPTTLWQALPSHLT